MTEICPRVELRIADSWVDVTDRARDAGPPQVVRGRNDESARTTPTTATLRLSNTDAALTPDNPESEWYPHVGLGTLLRLRVPADDPHLLVSGEFGSGAQTADHSSLDIVGDIHMRWRGYLAGIPAQGVTVAQKFGESGQWSWYFHVTPEGLLRFAWSTDGTTLQAPDSLVPIDLPSHGNIGLGVKLDVSNAGNHVITYETAPGTDGAWSDLSTETRSGVTSIFSSTAPLQLHATLYGARVRSYQLMSIINGTQVANPDFTAQASGVRSFTDATGRPWVLTGDAELTDERIRFCGEITSLEMEWPHASAPDDPLDEGVSHVAVEATGPLERMSQGEKALRSPLYRLATSAQNLPSVIAYWPCEDGSEATQASSPIEGVAPMEFGGDIRFASDDSHPGSEPLPEVSGDQSFGWNGRVPAAPGVTSWAVEWFFRIPTKETAPDSTVLSYVDSNGSARNWRLALSDSGFRVTATDPDGTQVINSLFSSSGWGSDWMRLRLEVEQTGILLASWTVSFAPVAGGAVSTVSDTFAGVIGWPTGIRAFESAPPGGLSVGHIVVTSGLDEGWLSPADRGWPSEPAGERLIRLAGEEGVVLTVVGDPAETAPMGVQSAGSFVDLLNESAEADMGILHEQRETIGLRYRTMHSLYNQAPALALDTALRDLSRDFAPTLNDQRTRNDIEVSRDGGSSARAVDQASINSAGLYDEQITHNLASDDLLAEHAGWRLHLGVWSEMRLPVLSTQLTRVPARVPAWLDSDLGDRVTATGLPRQYTGDADQLIEQYREAWTNEQWPVDLTVSPARPWDVGILDDSEQGRLSSDGSTISAGAGANSTTASTSHVAPSVYAPSANCLLISAWQNFDPPGNYTKPASMTAGPETDGATFSTMRSAYQQIAASGDTGTRTATFSASDQWSAVSALIRGAAGNPVIEETLSGVGDNADVVLTTADDTEAGWWLVAIHGWDLDADGDMPDFNGWALAADSGRSPDASPSASRTRIWVRKVIHSGPQTVTFRVLDDTGEDNDNHGHLYVLSGVSDFHVTATDTSLPVATPEGPVWITTATHPAQFPFTADIGGEHVTVTAITGTTSPQLWTVTRAVNGITKPHAVGTVVGLAEPLRLAL